MTERCDCGLFSQCRKERGELPDGMLCAAAYAKGHIKIGDEMPKLMAAARVDRYVLLDLDNCIADDAWRIPRINWSRADQFGRYHDYHSLSPWDTLHNPAILERHRGDKIIIMTTRPVWYRIMTEHWLHLKGIQPAHILMRNNDDVRTSVQVKRLQVCWLSEYRITLGQIVAAYDDRPEICAMYRSFGIEAHVRGIHDVCAYTNPNGERRV
jgi:hypothetical protein